MISFSNVLRLLQTVGPAVAATKEFKARFDAILEDRSEGDQAALKEALADLVADNDAGHARLQEKLDKAAGI